MLPLGPNELKVYVRGTKCHLVATCAARRLVNAQPRCPVSVSIIPMNDIIILNSYYSMALIDFKAKLIKFYSIRKTRKFRLSCFQTMLHRCIVESTTCAKRQQAWWHGKSLRITGRSWTHPPLMGGNIIPSVRTVCFDPNANTFRDWTDDVTTTKCVDIGWDIWRMLCQKQVYQGQGPVIAPNSFCGM